MTSSMRMVVTGSTAIENSSRQRISGSSDSARDREALLLAAGEAGAEVPEAVLHFVEQRGLAQATFHQVVEHGPLADSRHARRERDVVVDRHRQSDRKGEDDTDAAPQRSHVAHRRDILAIDADGALHAHAGDEVGHAVDALKKRGLARARGPDHGQDLALEHVERHAVEHDVVPVTYPQVADLDLRTRRHHFLRARR